MSPDRRRSCRHPSQVLISPVCPQVRRIPWHPQISQSESRRGGKSVVVVFGFDPGFSQSAIEELAREVRIQCGCGGTVREREIEFQGEDPDRFMRIFRDLL